MNSCRTSHFYEIKRTAALWAGLFIFGAALAQEPGPDVVGEITTAIGRGKIVGVAGERAIARGQRVQAGDRIETADGGHVHIRFVDGGLVSIEPLSPPVHEQYRKGDETGHQVQAPKGVIRSVTGQWGEANRDRFRLNTPIAAIGVKGTDFVVKVQPESTYASVVSGAIVMSPLDGSCAGSLGPCQTELAAHLSAEMQGPDDRIPQEERQRWAATRCPRSICLRRLYQPVVRSLAAREMALPLTPSWPGLPRTPNWPAVIRLLPTFWMREAQVCQVCRRKATGLVA